MSCDPAGGEDRAKHGQDLSRLRTRGIGVITESVYRVTLCTALYCN